MREIRLPEKAEDIREDIELLLGTVEGVQSLLMSMAIAYHGRETLYEQLHFLSASLIHATSEFERYVEMEAKKEAKSCEA